MIKRILLGIGGTAFTEVAIKRAVELAKGHEAKISAVTIVDRDRICNMGPVPAGAGFYARRLCENRLAVTKGQVEDALAALEKACKQAGVSCTVEWEIGDPFELMIRYARYHDLTVFGLRSIFDYQLVPQPEADLIRLLSHGVRPILAVSDHYRPIHRVIVAYSGSMESAKAMRHFVQSGLWPKAKVVLVHFSDGPHGGNALLNDAAAYCQDHGYSVSTRMIPGSSGDQLLDSAQELNADMIVMGNSIRSIWLRKVVGDTVLKMLTTADRPVFLAQ